MKPINVAVFKEEGVFYLLCTKLTPEEEAKWTEEAMSFVLLSLNDSYHKYVHVLKTLPLYRGPWGAPCVLGENDKEREEWKRLCDSVPREELRPMFVGANTFEAFINLEEYNARSVKDDLNYDVCVYWKDMKKLVSLLLTNSGRDKLYSLAITDRKSFKWLHRVEERFGDWEGLFADTRAHAVTLALVAAKVEWLESLPDLICLFSEQDPTEELNLNFKGKPLYQGRLFMSTVQEVGSALMEVFSAFSVDMTVKGQKHNYTL